MTTRPCAHNPAHRIPDDGNPDRRYCSSACRVAAFRQRQADAVAILRRQTTAVERKDGPALAAATRDARSLLSVLAVQ